MKLNTKIWLVMWLLLCPPIAFSSWVELSPEELVEQSKLAVIGEFIGSTRIASYGENNNIIAGIIKVETILNGSIDDEFILIALRKVDSPLISSAINFKKGQSGLWLLTQYYPGNTVLYSASHPQQFTPLTNPKTMNNLIKLVKKKKI